MFEEGRRRELNFNLLLPNLVDLLSACLQTRKIRKSSLHSTIIHPKSRKNNVDFNIIQNKNTDIIRSIQIVKI